MCSIGVTLLYHGQNPSSSTSARYSRIAAPATAETSAASSASGARGGLQLGTQDLLQMAVRDPLQPVAERDHLALLREADPTVLRRRGHGPDPHARPPAASPDGASATVEQPQLHALVARQAAERV